MTRFMHGSPLALLTARASVGLLGAMLAHCGSDPDAHRPVALTLGGLSSRAERLVVKVLPEGAGIACSRLDLQTVAEIPAPIQMEWVRSTQGGDKRLSLPRVDASRITIVAHSEEADGRVIQIACLGLDYLDLESPEIFMMLSRRES